MELLKRFFALLGSSQSRAVAITKVPANCAVLKLEPGDVLVYRCRHALSMSQARSIKEMLVDKFPNNHVLVVDVDADVFAVRSPTKESP